MTDTLPYVILLQEGRFTGLPVFICKEIKLTSASFWKIESNKYAFQFNHVKPKDRKVIFTLFKGWETTASGFHKNGTELFIFSKSLLEDESIYKFAKNIPFPTSEQKKDGTMKPVKNGRNKALTKSKKSATIRKQRTCSLCGQKGHNSRTCKA